MSLCNICKYKCYALDYAIQLSLIKQIFMEILFWKRHSESLRKYDIAYQYLTTCVIAKVPLVCLFISEMIHLQPSKEISQENMYLQILASHKKYEI